MLEVKTMENDAISRSELLNELRKVKWPERHFTDPDIRSLYQSIKKTFQRTIDFIEDFPAIDAVPVVRCMECKHFASKLHACCDATGAIVPMPYNAETFFCAYGERMDVIPDDSGQ